MKIHRISCFPATHSICIVYSGKFIIAQTANKILMPPPPPSIITFSSCACMNAYRRPITWSSRSKLYGHRMNARTICAENWLWSDNHLSEEEARKKHKSKFKQAKCCGCSDCCDLCVSIFNALLPFPFCLQSEKKTQFIITSNYIVLQLVDLAKYSDRQNNTTNRILSSCEFDTKFFGFISNIDLYH